MPTPTLPTIRGVASLDLVPEVNREFDPSGAVMTPEDYFILTRVDGHTSFKQICLIAGFPEQQTLTILAKLREVGAILLKGEPPPPRALKVAATGTSPPARTADGTGKVSAAAAPAATPPARQAMPPIPSALLHEEVDLSAEQRKVIWEKHVGLGLGNHFDLLGVPLDADKRAIKRAYFSISKEFHPDRFYGKRLGSFERMLAEIFKACSDAWVILEDDGKREAYRARVGGLTVATPGAPAVLQAQSKAERAAELFEAACQHEVTGDVRAALAEFRAAINLDPLPRYLRRAADACLRANELSSAEEYAKKFAAMSAQDAQAHRTLAKVLRALGRLEEAHIELETANRLDPESAHIASELEAVRKLLGR